MFTKQNLTMSRYCITGPVWKTLLHSKMVYISIYSQVSKQMVSNRMFSPIHHTIRNDCKYVIQTRLIALTIWYPNVTNLFKSFRTNKIIKYLIYCFFSFLTFWHIFWNIRTPPSKYEISILYSHRIVIRYVDKITKHYFTS